METCPANSSGKGLLSKCSKGVAARVVVKDRGASTMFHRTLKSAVKSAFVRNNVTGH